MILWVSGVVAVTPQATCGLVIRSVRKEKGLGTGSAAWLSRRSQPMVRPSSLAGVPVLSRPMARPRA